MANKSQLKAVGEQDFSESDPFAELTRIMGFDPRVQPTPRPEDDFQIDLEKELMGEFGDTDEHEDTRQKAEPSAGTRRDAFHAEAAPSVSQAVSYPPADDLEHVLTSVFQQELGGESDAHALLEAGGGEAASLPPEQEFLAEAEEPRAATIEPPAELESFEPTPPAIEPASGEAAAVEDRGPEFAQSLNRLLSDAGYRSGSSYSGTAQVYQISTSYITTPPAAEAPAAPALDEARTEEPSAIASEQSEQAQSFTQPRTTVFGTTQLHRDDGPDAPSEPVGSDAPSAFEAPFQEMEADAAVYLDSEGSFAPEASLEAEEVKEPEDPFAALAALGSEAPAQNFGAETHAPVAPPAPAKAISEARRFEGAARFYSSLDLFSRATPVAPGMRQPPRAPAPRPEQQVQEPAFTVEKETAFAAPVHAPEDESELADRAEELKDEIPADALEMAVLDGGFRAEDAVEEPAAPVLALSQADVQRPAARTSDITAPPAAMPEIETIDVPEPAVAIVDDLDIPTPPAEEVPPPAPVFDELDQEFVTAFSDLQEQERKASEQSSSSKEDDELTAKIEELFSSEEFDFSDHELPTRAAAGMPATAASPAARTRAPAGASYGPEAYAFQDEYYEAAAASAYAGMPEETPAYPSSTPLAVRDKKRRALAVDAIIACAFIAAAVGAFSYLHHSTKSSGPVLLKADAQPVKMKPKHPGGAKVPNQNNQVYKRVADGDVAAPIEQQKLVSSEEKPVDLSAQAKNAASASTLPGVDMPKIPQASSQEIAALAKSDAGEPQKNQDRVPPSHATGTDTSRADDVIAVEPRKVRTMIVKPDGTMVPTPLPAATPAAEPKSVATAALEEPAVKAAAGAKSASAAEHLQKAENQAVVTPQHVDVTPSRPAVQPVSIKEPARSEPGNEKVAALEATPAHPAVSAGWAMQIASQPTAQAAQASYQHLAHRYGSVLGGHGVDIVKAEISGKGTYYRVRVPASSRDEAIALCTKYKAAGGNCFVSK